MVSSHIFSFNPDCCSLTVVMRLLRFWKARKRGERLMGVHMLLLDEKIWLQRRSVLDLSPKGFTVNLKLM
ncbi:hypothetical protein Bca4012_064846 [Brassica carinata]